MRIEVPADVFDGLTSYRYRKGTMGLLDIAAVEVDFLANGRVEEAAWVLQNEELIRKGALLGFVKEGDDLPPDKPLESEETGDVL